MYAVNILSSKEYLNYSRKHFEMCQGKSRFLFCTSIMKKEFSPLKLPFVMTCLCCQNRYWKFHLQKLDAIKCPGHAVVSKGRDAVMNIGVVKYGLKGLSTAQSAERGSCLYHFKPSAVGWLCLWSRKIHVLSTKYYVHKCNNVFE